MKLSALTGKPHDIDPDITGLTADSRAVKPGFLFAALKGVASDGADFIPQAINAGAVAILEQGDKTVAEFPSNVIRIIDSEPRKKMAQLCARFYPEHPDFIAGITGTNGKTSTAQIASQIWALLGVNGGSIGTLGAQVLGRTGQALHLEIGHTTPDPVTLHNALQQTSRAGCAHMAMEVSSHGLAQFRCDGIKFNAGAFTNITQDHLDYHKNFSDYFSAKKRLFADLLDRDGPAIINSDGAGSDVLYAELSGSNIKTITTGFRGENIKLLKVVPAANGLEVQVQFDGTIYDTSLPLIGAFQAENVMLACAIIMQSGYSASKIIEVLPEVRGVPGRMMLAGQASGGAIYVDYAHTPDAISMALKAVRPHVAGRLIAIIGAGGDRDRTKRSLMGKAAMENADIVILADDNPRSENPDLIRGEIMEGAPSAINIGDRAKAIEAGVEILGQGDVLMVLGKGHETGQTIGDQTHPFEDAKVVAELVNG